LCTDQDAVRECEHKYVRDIISGRADAGHKFRKVIDHLPRGCNGVVCRERDYKIASKAFWDAVEDSVPEGYTEEEVRKGRKAGAKRSDSKRATPPAHNNNNN